MFCRMKLKNNNFNPQLLNYWYFRKTDLRLLIIIKYNRGILFILNNRVEHILFRRKSSYKLQLLKINIVLRCGVTIFLLRTFFYCNWESLVKVFVKSVGTGFGKLLVASVLIWNRWNKKSLSEELQWQEKVKNKTVSCHWKRARINLKKKNKTIFVLEIRAV